MARLCSESGLQVKKKKAKHLRLRRLVLNTKQCLNLCIRGANDPNTTQAAGIKAFVFFHLIKCICMTYVMPCHEVLLYYYFVCYITTTSGGRSRTEQVRKKEMCVQPQNHS